jgi:multidrug efflux pump
MVPVMITAPTVMWSQIRWLGSIFAAVGAWIASPFRQKEEAAPAGFDGMAVEIPEDADSSKRYIVSKDAGLTEKQANGVTVVSRRDAAE